MSGSDRNPRFNDALRAIVATYDRGEPIDNLESAALPNKRRCIEALQELESILFMGFYATSPITRETLPDRVAEHLQRAHAILVDQTTRALTYHDWYGGPTDAPEPSSAEDIVLGLFESLPELRRILGEDVRAAYEGDPAAQSIEEIVFSYPSVTAIVTYRIAHRLYQRGVPMIPRMLSEHAHAVSGIDIHPGAEVGKRFFVDHGTGVVVGATAVIGDNVKLYQGVTLGAVSVPRRGDLAKRHPTLEDDVTVYSGATILGGETVIGRGSVIGGNVWLVESVPPGSKVFGGRKAEGFIPSE